MEKKNNAGAIASNAGDDFHLIWACKKLLEILKPNSELTAISVEGPTWTDSVQISEEEALYSIDLAEYYGGTNFEDANSVAFSQLKYSTYQMGKDWTASVLCTKTSKNKDNSIIRRLADTYKKFASEHASSINKLTLKLVSNRKLDVGFSESINEAVCVLNQKECSQTATLLKKLSPEHQTDIEKLYKASNLSSNSFICFLLALNFDDCGTGIRSIHRAEVIKQMGKWSTGNLHNKYNSLISDIRERMLPEQPTGVPIVKEDVLAALETSSMELFPAPSKIEVPSHSYIERRLCNTISTCFKENPKSVICIQATAGIGKTTFASHIKDSLPKDSVTVLYDCYGGGSFLQDSERRHLTEVAIPQICNTLAAECGTDWLIGKTMHDYEYWKAFNQRLEDSVYYVNQQNPEAVVVIIVDAADNSKMAADFFSEDCFLNGLLRDSFPEGAFLVITTRTERACLLPFGREVCTINLPSFERCESSAHLRSVFENAVHKQCEEFHLLTNGNPRLQAYLLSGAESIECVLTRGKPTGQTIEGLFKEFIHSVEMNYRDLLDIELLLGSISILPRPIPADLLCGIVNISIEMLQSISVECHDGFYITGSNVSLRDEDFEDFLKRNYGSSQATIACIAQYMYAKRNSDPYSARYVHLFLNQANQFEQLLEIALDERVDDTTIGIAQANKIMRQRIQFTLKRPEIASSRNNLLTCKLVYRLIDYNANEDMLSGFLIGAPDEAILYCDELSVHNTFQTESNDFESLAKAALAFSHFPVYQDDARQYIKSYIAEIKHYFNAPKDKRNIHSRPNTSNIIWIAEAMLRLGETQKAVDWLCRWEPKIVETEHVFELFCKLLNYQDEEYCNLLLSQKWSAPSKLAIACAYISLGKEPSKDYVEYLVRLFRRLRTIPEKRFSDNQLLLFTEYILSAEHKNVATELIDRFSINRNFSSAPSLYMENEKQDFLSVVRYCALRHFCKNETVNLDSYWIDREAADSKRSSESKQSFKQMADFLLPLYLLRLSCIQNNTDSFILCKDAIQKLERQTWSYSSYDKHQLLETGLLVFSEAICCPKSFGANDICELTKAILSACQTSQQFKLKLLDSLSRNTLAANASLLILEEIDNCFKNHPTSAREMTEVYLSCSQIGRRIHADLGKVYFIKALSNTKGQDYESYRKLYLYKTLSEKICGSGEDNPKLAYNIIRLSEDFCRKQGDTKNFPYEEAIGSAALLSPQSIWGTLCRLDDRDNYDGFSLMDTVPIVLNTLFEAEKLSAEDTTALTGLLLPDCSSQYNELADAILSKIISRKPSEQKSVLEILIHDVLYNIPMDEKEYRSLQISRYLKTNVISPKLNTKKINAMSNFLQSVSKDIPCYRQAKTEVVSNIDVKQFMVEHDIVSRQNMKDCLGTLMEPERNSLIRAWLESQPPDQYVSSLELVLDVIGEDYSYSSSGATLETIAAFVDSVSGWPEVDRWRNNPATQGHYLQLLAKYFLYLYRGYEGICNTVLHIFPADYQVQALAFSSYVANYPILYDEQLVKAICRMCMALSIENATVFLQWATENEMRHIHPASGDAKSYEIIAGNSENSLDTMCCFVWRLLGHKDKGIRCKATHVLLRATALGNLDMVRDISKLYDLQLPKWYMNDDNCFFADSAKLCYLASCSRIAKINPENLLPLYQFFKDIALAKGTTHALHRRIAKDTCLTLAPICDSDAVEQLASCDKCIPITSESEITRHRYEDSNDTENLKFHFDTMDTLPYWYIHVASIFSCTQAQVARDCDYFIAQFGITNEECHAWSRKHLSRDDYSKTYNNHGAIPTVETLTKYAEWHSMFYVADRYRQMKPMDTDACEAYEAWINNHIAGIDGFWCYEFRNHVPLIPFLWDFKLTVSCSEPLHIIPEGLERTLVENELGISLYMGYSAHLHNSNRRISIKSAFIEKEHAEQLIEGLKRPDTIFDDFYCADDEYCYREQPEFFIYPTYNDLASYPDYAVDKKDLLLKDYSGYLVGVSESVCNHIGVSREECILHARAFDNTDFPVKTYNWNEPEAESGYEKHGTNGRMVIMDAKYLSDLLKATNQAIVFEVSVVFKDDDYNFYGTPRKPAKSKKLLVFSVDEKNAQHWGEHLIS